MGYTDIQIERINEFYQNDDDKLDAALRAGRIDSKDKLKLFPNLDAGLIRFIIGPIDNNTIVSEYIPEDTSVCEANGCTVWNRMKSITDLPDALKSIPDENPEDTFSEVRMLEECRMECAHCPYHNAHCKKSYINPKQRYNLYNRFRNRLQRPKLRLTKLHIKLMLLFQAWPAELVKKSGKYNGILSNVYVPDLSEILDCNADYLEDCLKDIGNMSLIDLDWISPHAYNVTMPDYYLKYEKASLGGGGYIQIDRNMLQSLLSENSITVLRGKLLQLLSNPVSDSYSDKPKILTLSELRAVMPKYVNYRAQYKKALDNDLFSMRYDNRLKKIIYKAKDSLKTIAEHKLEIMKENVKWIGKAIEAVKPTFITDKNTFFRDSSYVKNIDSILDNSNKQVPTVILKNKNYMKFLSDALQISVEYGFVNVTKAIKQLELTYRCSQTPINNAGARLRMQCCYNMLNGIS